MGILEYALMTAGSLLSIINPLAAVPAFLAMTPNDTVKERLRMARTACLTCAFVLIAFSSVGTHLFKLFGITLPSFQMAGGLILLLIALDNLRAKRSAVHETEEERAEGTSKQDVSITPLAIPMLSGPGAITTAILLESKASGLPHYLILYTMFIAVSAVCYLVFHIAVKRADRISPIAMNIVTRIMGLILAATAMEFILSAAKTAFGVH